MILHLGVCWLTTNSASSRKFRQRVEKITTAGRNSRQRPHLHGALGTRTKNQPQRSFLTLYLRLSGRGNVIRWLGELPKKERSSKSLVQKQNIFVVPWESLYFTKNIYYKYLCTNFSKSFACSTQSKKHDAYCLPKILIKEFWFDVMEQCRKETKNVHYMTSKLHTKYYWVIFENYNCESDRC